MSRSTQVVHVTRERRFTDERDFDAFAVIRVANRTVTDLGGRNRWVVMTGPSRRPVYRVIRGVKASVKLPVGAMETYYETNNALGIGRSQVDADGFYECDVYIRSARILEIGLAHWNHPDGYYRFPIRISLVALALGVIGLFLGIVSLFK